MRGVQVDPERREMRMLERCVPIEGARLLEIGCGSGRLTRRLAARTSSLLGFDTTHETVKNAHRLMPERLRQSARVVVASGVQIPFRDRSFDVTLFSWSL